MAISERKRLILTAIAVTLVGMLTGLLLGGDLLPSQAAGQLYNERVTTERLILTHTHDGSTHTHETTITMEETTPHGYFHNPAPASLTSPTTSSGTVASGGGRPMNYEVLQANRTFFPDVITVPVGATVTWTSWDTEMAVHEPHTVVDDSGLFDSGSIYYRASFSYTYTKPGIYPYHCTPHGEMHGKVIVVE